MTPPSPTIDVGALARYLDGTASPEDHAAVEAWIGTDPARRAAVATLQAAWDADARRLGAPYDVDAAWRRFETGYGGPKRSGRWNLAIAAAVVAAVMAAGAAWWLGRDARSVAQAPATREYATPRGRRAVLRLLDGTEITLNADSKLRAPVTFATGQRDVYLEGEAYFSVVHDAARPFIVHTAGGAVRDIDPALARRPVTGSYGDEPVAQVLTLITAAVGARYEWQGRTVAISTAQRAP